MIIANLAVECQVQNQNYFSGVAISPLLSVPQIVLDTRLPIQFIARLRLDYFLFTVSRI